MPSDPDSLLELVLAVDPQRRALLAEAHLAREVQCNANAQPRRANIGATPRQPAPQRS